MASWLISQAGGWGVIPPTVLRQGPWGSGSVQEWIGDPRQGLERVVELVPADDIPEGRRIAFTGQDHQGAVVAVIHQDCAQLRSVAVLDVVLNNADRKGEHLARDPADGRVWAFDHGVTLHTEDKLRTVVWGFVGEPVQPEDLQRLRVLADALADRGPGCLTEQLAEYLCATELAALHTRVARLRRAGVMPSPSPDWPSIPWPPI